MQYGVRSMFARMTRLAASGADFAEGDGAPISVDSGLRLRVTNGGILVPYKRISAATINAISIVVGAGTLWNVEAFTNGSSVGYVKVFDLATAPDPVGGSVPIKTWMIPGISGGAGFIRCPSRGVPFTTGLGLVITGGIADSDATAVAANAFVVNIEYELGG